MGERNIIDRAFGAEPDAGRTTKHELGAATLFLLPSEVDVMEASRAVTRGNTVIDHEDSLPQQDVIDLGYGEVPLGDTF